MAPTIRQLVVFTGFFSKQILAMAVPVGKFHHYF